jgi:hypothetical protein
MFNIYFVQHCWGRLFAYNIQYVVANFRYVRGTTLEAFIRDISLGGG